MKVLIADDSPVTRHMLRAAVELWGYEVVEASDGNEAWQILQEDDAPRIAMLDLIMPGMDGKDVCEKVRQAIRERYTYIIQVTTKSDRQTMIDCLEAGADDFLVKPCDPEELEQRLRAGCRVIDLQDELLGKNKQLTQAKANLERSNADLNQFASIVAHDLQAPLRHITGFCDILRKKYRGRFDEQADEFLDAITDSTKRMSALITDLLEYSRLERVELEYRPTDTGAVAARVIQNLSTIIEQASGKVTHDDLPTVNADETLLEQLFQNLIQNGIKYRGEEAPHVHISAAREGDSWVFSFRDNGIGIEPAYQQQIFEAFTRLHGTEKYQGTGVGLAICLRVVQLHGGRIWVESKLGEGSNFLCTIPL